MQTFSLFITMRYAQGYRCPSVSSRWYSRFGQPSCGDTSTLESLDVIRAVSCDCGSPHRQLRVTCLLRPVLRGLAVYHICGLSHNNGLSPISSVVGLSLWAQRWYFYTLRSARGNETYPRLVSWTGNKLPCQNSRPSW